MFALLLTNRLPTRATSLVAATAYRTSHRTIGDLPRPSLPALSLSATASPFPAARGRPVGQGCGSCNCCYSGGNRSHVLISDGGGGGGGKDRFINAPYRIASPVHCHAAFPTSASSASSFSSPSEGLPRVKGASGEFGSGGGGESTSASSAAERPSREGGNEPGAPLPGTQKEGEDDMEQALKASEAVAGAARSVADTAKSMAAMVLGPAGPAESHPIRPPADKMRSYARFPGVGTLPKGNQRVPGLVRNVWGMEAQHPAFPRLLADTTCDVLIVGAGLGGLCIAYQLARDGHDVVVLEARVRGGGQSGRTSAHIMQWNDDWYGTIESKYGKEGARQVAESHLAAIDFHERVVRDEGIECDFTRLDGYLFLHDDKPSTVQMLRDELTACLRAGMSDVRLVDLSADPKYGKLGQALLFPRSAEFHPLKYINGLANVLTKKYGVRLYENTRVQDSLDPQLAGTVSISTGAKVTARKSIVYATNSPINRNVAVHARQEANRTYMIGFKVPKGSTARANWWSTEHNYHYIRLQPGDVDGKQPYDVLLVGGEDHQTGQYPSKYSDSWEALEAFTRARWPQAGEVLYRWSGQVYEPIDLLGLYGLDPLNPVNTVTQVKRYIATGDSGQGMTGSAIAALILADLIAGRAHPWAELYSPSRIKPALNVSSLEDLASEAAATARGLADTVLPRSALGLMGRSQEDHLKPGEGAVLQEGATKVAAFRTPEGVLIKHSAICPHMGCLLEWNPNDATFDCVCHGSQFDSCGNCINGPANSNLKKLS